MARGLQAARALEVAHAAYGAGLLLAPPSALAALAGSPLDRPVVRVARVLGTRHLIHAALLWAHPGPRWQLSGAAVDAAHAASMRALARWSQRPVHRRLAARDARIAELFAGAGCVRGSS
jgi:hypothetical protein